MKGMVTREPARRYVYSTAPFTRVQKGEAEIVREPTSMLHGKVVGTTLTLCGESAQAWFKFYDMHFESATGERCPQCAAIVGIQLLGDVLCP